MTTTDAENLRPRGALVRWTGWFGIVNAALFALVGTRYLFAFGWPESGIAILYVGLAFVAQFALLGYLPLMILLGPLAVALPRKAVVMTVGVVLASAGLTLLLVDTNVFAQYRYHVSRLTMEIFEPSTWLFTGFMFLMLLAFQSMLAGNVWKRLRSGGLPRGGRLALLLVLAWFGAQGIHIWADATAYSPVTSFTRYLPLYFPMKAKRRLAKLGWIDPEAVEQQRLLRGAGASGSGQLLYPINELQCTGAAPTPNILVILVDALRPDHVNSQLTPRIAAFAAQGQHFRNHYSGGNSSRMGIFSMFYGLPSTYWQAFYDLQRPPVLMDQLQERDYEIAAFSAVGFTSPAQIDRTVFAAVDPSRRYSAVRDQDRNGEITEAWAGWFNGRADPEKPFFSFLYYDPGKSPASEGVEIQAATEVEQRHESYRRGISAVDNEVATVLDTLAGANTDRQTLVILASDHGYEFDELGLGYIGHGSNYGPWQLRSVLVMDWPGREPHAFDHRSAHQDLPGTLMSELFGCSNPVADYSSGGKLFDGESWEWIMAGSYSSSAIVEPDKIIVTYPGGLIELLDADYRPTSDVKLDPRRIEEAMLEMRRFYQ